MHKKSVPFFLLKAVVKRAEAHKVLDLKHTLSIRIVEYCYNKIEEWERWKN